jgi:hypothetical protein
MHKTDKITSYLIHVQSPTCFNERLPSHPTQDTLAHQYMSQGLDQSGLKTSILDVYMHTTIYMVNNDLMMIFLTKDMSAA